MKNYEKFYINGEWVDPIDGLNLLDVINPTTEEAICKIAMGGEKDVDARHYPDVQAWIESKKNSWCEWAYLWDGQDWLVHQIKDEETDYPVFDFADVVLLQHQKEIAEMAK